MAKPWAVAFYHSPGWKKCREAYANKVHHLCERCLAKGILKPGEIVHHKIELTPENINDPNVSLSFSNLMMVCRECHAEIHETGWAQANAKKREACRSSERYIIEKDGKVTSK